MLQLGSNPVSYMEGKPRKPVVPDSIKVVLTYAKRHTDAEALESALKNAQDLTKKLLKFTAKVEFLDVRPPTRIAGASDALQVIVFAPVSASTALLRASGLDIIVVCQYRKQPRSRNLQGCSDASRCHIKHVHRTGAISRRESFRRGFLWCRLWNSNEKLRFR